MAALAALRGRLALLAVIGAGGATGTAARYGTELAIEPGSDGYPAATFLVNVVGAVILGLEITALGGTQAANNKVRQQRTLQLLRVLVA